MLRAVIVLAVIVVALVRGGSLRHFADLRVRAPWLAAAGFIIQLLIFTPFVETPIIAAATVPLYVLSMALVIAWAVMNRHIPGGLLMTAGVVSNTVAIVANGGLMPIWPVAAEIAGRLDDFQQTGAPVYNNSVAMDSGVQLWILTDILPVPAWVPLATVYSIGDVLLTTGVCILCYTVIRRGAPAAPTSQPTSSVADREPA